MSPGRQNFYAYDPHALVNGQSDIHSTPLDDEALARLDVWLDGGNRDLFNSYPAARHLAGTFVGRDRDTVALSEFSMAAPHCSAVIRSAMQKSSMASP